MAEPEGHVHRHGRRGLFPGSIRDGQRRSTGTEAAHGASHGGVHLPGQPRGFREARSKCAARSTWGAVFADRSPANPRAPRYRGSGRKAGTLDEKDSGGAVLSRARLLVGRWEAVSEARRGSVELPRGRFSGRRNPRVSRSGCIGDGAGDALHRATAEVVAVHGQRGLCPRKRQARPPDRDCRFEIGRSGRSSLGIR